MIEKIDVCLIISFVMLVPLSYITWQSVPFKPATQFDLGLLRNASNFTPNEEKVIDDLYNILESENNDNHKIIFLLGGPGVGKANLTSILKESIERVCTQNEEYNYAFYKRNLNFIEERPNLMATLCDNHYSKFNKSLILAADYIYDFKTIIYNNQSDEYFGNFYNIEDKCLKKWNLKFIHIITGPIMTEEDIERFKNAEEYEIFVDESAMKLGDKLQKLAPDVRFHIIQFKPMIRDNIDMMSSLRNSYITYDSEFWQMYDNYIFSKDFIPHGSKFVNHLIKKRLARLEKNNDD